MSPSSQQPVIGVTLDFEEAGGYSKFPWYAVRENYCAAVRHAGGLPVLLPHTAEDVNAYLEHIDGLVITGGNFDVDPALFGDKTRHDTVTLKENRTSFEIAVTKSALEKKMPILGICGGQQLLNVVLGGTLIQHIPAEIQDPLAHEQPNPRNEAGHTIEITKGTMLYDIVGATEMNVNSAHHQAAKEVAAGTIINAVAPDGVIEGIEAPAERFCLGVQWHPEFEIDDGDSRIFDAFVSASRS